MKIQSKVTVKVGNRVLSIAEFSTKCRNLRSTINAYTSKAADEIQKMIGAVAVQGTIDPKTASIRFREYFDRISRDSKPPSTHSPLGGITEHDREQDALIGLSLERSGSKIKLGEQMNFWDYKIIDGGDGTYKHRRNSHAVDHVLCHLTGYNLYEKIPGHKSLMLSEFIKGRDIILCAVMMAAPYIQKGLRNIVENEFR